MCMGEIIFGTVNYLSYIIFKLPCIWVSDSLDYFFIKSQLKWLLEVHLHGAYEFFNIRRNFFFNIKRQKFNGHLMEF